MLGVKQTRIQVLGNIPGHPKESIDQIELEIPIRLVLISRLSPKKNIGGLIRQLMEVKAHVVVNVYGPFDDGRYKNEVYRLVDSLPSNVSLFFNKPIHPDEVDRVISKAHFFILLTHGENFGHSIFEALAVGRPVIISRHTPWTETVEKGAGYIWDSSNTLQDIIENISRLSQEEYETQCRMAYEAAKRYYQDVTSNSRYEELFSLNS